MLNLGVIGAAGRMGQALVHSIAGRSDCQLVAAVVRPGASLTDRPLGSRATTDNPAMAFELADIVIDFSSPGTTQRHAALARQYQTGLVVGTTGLDAQALEDLRSAAASVPIFYAANMSIGVALLRQAVEIAARHLQAPDWDIEIVETHHRHKGDAPSGTALALGQAAALGRGVDIQTMRLPADRNGPRQQGGIGFASLRGGDIVGEHTVLFLGTGESLSFSHRATDRRLFAEGAVRAALWLNGRAPGFYGMDDLLPPPTMITG